MASKITEVCIFTVGEIRMAAPQYAPLNMAPPYV